MSVVYLYKFLGNTDVHLITPTNWSSIYIQIGSVIIKVNQKENFDLPYKTPPLIFTKMWIEYQTTDRPSISFIQVMLEGENKHRSIGGRVCPYPNHLL
jgi:hypothetical protein